MFFLLLAMFGTCMGLATMCQAGNFPGSDSSPLTILYTVYPNYNPEALFGVLRAEEPLQFVSGDLGQDIDDVRAESSTFETGTSHDDSKRLENSYNETARQPGQRPTEITYWPPVQRGAIPKLRLGRNDAHREI